MVDRSRCKHIISRHYGYSVLVHLTLWVIPYLLTCRPVNLSPWVDRLTGRQVNKYIISICLLFLYLALGMLILSLARLCVMGILYLFTCRPVNLSTCRGHEIIPDIMDIPFLFICRPVNMFPIVDRCYI